MNTSGARRRSPGLARIHKGQSSPDASTGHGLTDQARRGCPSPDPTLPWRGQMRHEAAYPAVRQSDSPSALVTPARRLRPTAPCPATAHSLAAGLAAVLVVIRGAMMVAPSLMSMFPMGALAPIPPPSRDDDAPGQERRCQYPNRQHHTEALHEPPPRPHLAQIPPPAVAPCPVLPAQPARVGLGLADAAIPGAAPTPRCAVPPDSPGSTSWGALVRATERCGPTSPG